MALECDRDVIHFLGVHIFRLSTRCKMFHSKITYPFPQKSHECALKLTDLWMTSLLFDLKYNNRVYVRGHKYVLGPTQTHFSPSR